MRRLLAWLRRSLCDHDRERLEETWVPRGMAARREMVWLCLGCGRKAPLR